MDSGPILHSPQRAFGRLRVAFARRDALTALAVLRQEGCLKARHPRPEPGAIAETVLLNTSGGITGGDDLGIDIRAGAGTRLVVTTQAAERLYRATPASPPATIRTRLTAAAGATLEWLPQETILFDACRADRTLSVDLAPSARFLGVESLLFGRQASGETMRRAWLTDRIRRRRRRADGPRRHLRRCAGNGDDPCGESGGGGRRPGLARGAGGRHPAGRPARSRRLRLEWPCSCEDSGNGRCPAAAGRDNRTEHPAKRCAAAARLATIEGGPV